MTFRRRQGLRPEYSRRALFEPLEPRHLLAGSNLAITTNADVQQMPSVAVDPHDSQHVMVAYMDYSLMDRLDNPTTPTVDESYDHPYAGIGVAESFHGGEDGTWHYSSVALPANFAQGAANPTVKFDNQGHVFVSYMAATFLGKQPPITNPSGKGERAFGFSSNNGIFVSRMVRNVDESISWLDAKSVASHLYNGIAVPFDIIPDIAVDSSRIVTTGAGTFNPMYVTFSRYYPAGLFPGQQYSGGGSQIMIAVSVDGGEHWKEQTKERADTHTVETVIAAPLSYNTGLGLGPGLGFLNWSHVAVGPQGDVYVSLFEFNYFEVFHLTFNLDGTVKTVDAPDLLTGQGEPFGHIPVSAGLDTPFYRAQQIRGIVADPSRPGTIYAMEGDDLDNPTTTWDQSDVIFSRSNDNGKTWESTFQIGDNNKAGVVNDDNDGNRLRIDHLNDDLADYQLMPRMVVDAQGNVALIWYDSRRDPANHLLDVYGSVGKRIVKQVNGKNVESFQFSPNFRITDDSFDVNHGAFTNAAGGKNFKFFGDTIGLALADGVMYSAWTGVGSTGKQDIFFRRTETSSIEPPPNDRYEPNDSSALATDVGPVFFNNLPRLALATGDEDWFKLKFTTPTGWLNITANGSADLARVNFQLQDGAGHEIPWTVESDASGHRFFRVRVEPGMEHNFFLRVSSDASANFKNVKYALSLSLLTDDLGEIVHQKKDDTLQSGSQVYYLIQSKVAGAIEATITPSAGFSGDPVVEILDLRDPTNVLAKSSAGNLRAVAPVDAGQQLLVRVTGGVMGDGAFRIEVTNHDQFHIEIPDNNKLFLPEGQDPAEVAIANLNPSQDKFPDLVVSDTKINVVSVFMGNGDGSFGAPRQFSIGAFVSPIDKPGQIGRTVAVDDFNHDAIPDVVVTNLASSDISVLLGNGDGTFQPQRRFNATASPFTLAVGDFNGDQVSDLVVVDSAAHVQGKFAILLGRADGTFQPPRLIPTPLEYDVPLARVRIADFNNDHRSDLLFTSDGDAKTFILLGNGDGSFRQGQHYIGLGPAVAVYDLNNDGNMDVVQAHYATHDLTYLFGNGDGTFTPYDGPPIATGQAPFAVAVADYTGDGIQDLIVANSGLSQPLFAGPPTVVLLQGLDADDDPKTFDGFDDPRTLATLTYPHDLQIADLNGDKVQDVVVADREGIFIIFGKQPSIIHNDTRETARNLRTVVHVVQPTLTITPSNKDNWYRLRVASEAFDPNLDQVLDFSGGFANQADGGLMMEVIDAAGKVRARGERFRLVARQGEELFVHVFGKADGGVTGSGAYTLVIDTLPQLAAVEAQSLLPNGPTTSLVLVFQGERLNTAAAENPNNYHVAWLGPDGVKGGGDDRNLPVGQGLSENSQPVIYDRGSNIDVASGLVYPTAVRQTVTLLFAQPLPAGNYEVVVTSDVVSEEFNSDEITLLTPRDKFHDHPVVSADGVSAIEDVGRVFTNLVDPVGGLGDLAVFEKGTPFLSQFQNDLGALLDALVATSGDDLMITDHLLQQIIAQVGAALKSAGLAYVPPLLVGFADPPSSAIVDPLGLSSSYDRQTNVFRSSLKRAFVSVGSNLDLVVIVNPNGDYQLSFADIPPKARAGFVYFGNGTAVPRSLTQEIQGGRSHFTFHFGLSTADHAYLAGLDSAARLVSSFSPITPIRSDFAAGVATLTALARDQALLILPLTASKTHVADRFDVGAGGAIVRQWRAAIDRAWDDLSGLWDELDQAVLGGDASKPNDAASDNSDQSTEHHVWSALWQAWGDLFEGNRRADAPQDRAKRPADKNEAASTNAVSSQDEQSDSNSAGASPSSIEDQKAASSTPDQAMPSDAAVEPSGTTTGGINSSASIEDGNGSEPNAAAA